jgi:peptidoglycan hydrolase-like protein with peptidoglycan-binding domain
MTKGKLTALVTGLALCAWLGGAQAQDKPTTAQQNQGKALELSVKPSGGPPRANVTGFNQALRCMDTQFRTYGVKNVSVIIEDIPDQTKKVNVGGREMFVSATSQMTRSSRAIRLIPYDGNRRVFQDLFKGQDDIASKAAFAIQGSISQFDEALLKKQRDGGICLGVLCIGGADSDSFSGMSVDMSVLNVRDDLTLVPGAISKNFVLIRKSGKGADADLNYKKFGINFNFTATQSDGNGQALRNLVELSAIELFGRLMKIPYWECLGVPATDEGVVSEIEDWWDMLQGDVPSLVTYLQIQMQTRGLYKGEIDGVITDELERAVRAYKGVMGLKEDLTLDAEFFRKYLTSKHAELTPKALARLKEINTAEGPLPAPAAATAQAESAPEKKADAAPVQVAVASPGPAAAQKPAAAARAALTVQGTKGPQYSYKRGEPLDVDVAVFSQGFLYCFLLDENRTVSQFFPNPVQPSGAVTPGTRMLFPGRFPFQFLASAKGATETVACFTTAKDLGPNITLPNSVKDVPSLQQAVAQRAGAGTEMGVFDVKVK